MKKTISFLMLSLMMSAAHAEFKGCGDIHGSEFNLDGLTFNNYVSIQLGEDGMINGQNVIGSTPLRAENQRAETIQIVMRAYSDLPRRIKAKQSHKITKIDYSYSQSIISFPQSSPISLITLSGDVDDIQKSKSIIIICTPKPVVDVVELLKKDLKSPSCVQDA